MNLIEPSLELALKKEARHRELLDMHEKKDWQSLLGAAKLLNEALYNQQVIAKWLAKEAAANLEEAAMAHYK